VLVFCAVWGGKLLGASRIAKSGAWGPLRCVVVGSWHLVASSGYPLGIKASRLELSGVHKVAKALGSTCSEAWDSRSHSSCFKHGQPKSAGSKSSEACLLALGYLELWQLLQARGIQAFRQHEFWCLLSRYGLQSHSTVVL
jgi:hypothetical protein